MRRLVLGVFLVAGCGRLGFDAAGDGGRTDAVPVSCAVDDDCGSCQRCTNQRCETADFVQVSLGFTNGCALDERSDVWCWGANQYNNQGITDGTGASAYLRPRRIGLANVAEIATGWGVAIARRTDRSLWGWGSAANTPGFGIAALDASMPWGTITAGAFNACAQAASGELWCVGDNSHGQLGRGTAVQDQILSFGPFAPTTNVASFVTGETTCVIDSAGRLFCLGRNSEGQLGQGTPGPSGLALTEIGAGGWSSVSTNYRHACAIRTDGTLWCWGAAPDTGFSIDAFAPAQVGGTFQDWSWIKASYDFSCAVRAGQLYCFGRNDSRFLLALGVETAGPTLVDIRLDPGTLPEIGGMHACVRDGGIWKCFGANDRGQVGVDSQAAVVSTPTPLCSP